MKIILLLSIAIAWTAIGTSCADRVYYDEGPVATTTTTTTTEETYDPATQVRETRTTRYGW